LFRRVPLLGFLTTASALFAKSDTQLDLGRLQTGATVSFTRSRDGNWGIEISGAVTPRVRQPQPAKLEVYRTDADIRQLSTGYNTVRKTPAGADARAEIAYGETTVSGGVDEYLDWAVPSYARLYNLTKDAHYLDVARVLLHDTKSMVALPGRQYDVKGIGWQQEGWRMGQGASRGVGGHRFWLPWISANHLYGIAGLEEYDPVLFKQLSARPAAAANTGGR
jgi:hypothetical protein